MKTPLQALTHWVHRAHDAENTGQLQEAIFANGVIFGLKMAYGEKLRLPGMPEAAKGQICTEPMRNLAR